MKYVAYLALNVKPQPRRWDVTFCYTNHMSKADERNDISIDEYIASIPDEAVQQDAKTLIDIMHGISGAKPQLYGIGTIGFGVYKYEYTTGRKGEAHTLAFYPRKARSRFT